MQYRTVPSTGDSVSVLAFGAMRLPQKDGSIDRPAARAMLDHALSAGVNLIDTAWPYHMGESESFLGEALEPYPRHTYFIMTKLPSWLVEKAEDMNSFLTAQLERLRTSYIDYYLLHSLNKKTWGKLVDMGVISFLETAKKEGRIRHIGFSFHDDYDTFVRIVDAYTWDVCLVQYNYLDEKCQAGSSGVAYAASKGLGVFVMEPLRGGTLAGTAPSEVAALFSSADASRSNASWGLDWVWNHREVVSVLSGMSTLEQVSENCLLAGKAHPGMLTASEIDTLNSAADAYRRLLRIKCTGCMYCLPCPSGVDIPSCFELYNYRHTFGGTDAKRRYRMWLSGKQPAHASLCTSCGACLEHCPQSLDIPAELTIVRRDFEGARPPARMWGISRPTVMRRWLSRNNNHI